MTPLQERITRERKEILAEIKEAEIDGDIDFIISRTNDFNRLDEDPEAYFLERDIIEEELNKKD